MNPKWNCVRAGVSGLTALMATAAAGEALAAPCKDQPLPVFVQGANAVKPLIKRLGTELSKASPPETIIFQGPGQCVGMNGLIDSVKMTGTASYFDAAGAEVTCELSLTGDAVEVAAMNSYATLCPGIASLPAGIGDFLGPVQSFDFIVPEASSQTSISAAAAYFVYGFGQAGEAAPWTDEANIFKRNNASGVSLFVALAIGVPVDKLKGIDAMTNANTVTLVSTSATPESAIGIVSGEVAEASAAVVNTLAYQHYGQTCGYWPSSTPSSFDKRNIRDGHYFIWSPIHFFAAIDGNGSPTVPGAAKLVGYFSGAVAPPSGIDMLDVEIKSGTVPDCAMEVKRSADLGPVSAYAPDEPCGCFFELGTTGATTCEACTTDPDCPVNAPNCRHGYCEVN